jgi:2-keto-4-pentenoate hydratase/2-oxohepta-3-ene-1,7-dioic acid hydratase in catechol pathway
MRLMSYRPNAPAAGPWRAAVKVGDHWVDAALALGFAPAPPPGNDRPGPAACTTVRDLLRSGLDEDALQEWAARAAEAGQVLDPGAIHRGPPVPDPEKILCFGVNYRDHGAESDIVPPSSPMLFAKFRNSLCGPYDTVRFPALAAARVDYEGELAVVIGHVCRRVSAADALDHVAGATVLNDVTARDLQHETTQWTVGKAVDDFAPCGPELVTLSELGDVGDLRITTRVNGEVVQDASTADMIFSVAELVAFLSRTMTLQPGDLIATGTPAGVGAARTPPLFLKRHDRVEVAISGIGSILNTFDVEIEEPLLERTRA